MRIVASSLRSIGLVLGPRAVPALGGLLVISPLVILVPPVSLMAARVPHVLYNILASYNVWANARLLVFRWSVVRPPVIRVLHMTALTVVIRSVFAAPDEPSL